MINNISMVSFNQIGRTNMQADTFSSAADGLRAVTRSCVTVLGAWAAEEAVGRRTADDEAVLGSASGARARG